MNLSMLFSSSRVRHPRVTSHSNPSWRTALLGLSLVLAGCESAIIDVPAPVQPVAPRLEPRVLAEVTVEYDPATGVAHARLVPAQASMEHRLPTSATALNVTPAVVNVSTGFEQTGKAGCSGCGNGTAGSHTITVPLKSLGIFAELSVGNLNCTNCNPFPTASGLPTEAVPDETFTVSVTVDVLNVQPFTVSFAIMGVGVNLTFCVKHVGFANDHVINVDGTGNIADPVWTQQSCDEASTEIEPVAYTSGTKVTLSGTALKATLQPQINKAVQVKIEAESSTNGFPMKFTFANVQVPGAGGTIQLPQATADQALPAGQAAVVHPLSIQWSYFLPTAPAAPVGIGGSAHPLYVTYKAPSTSPLYLTVLDHTTRGAAGQANDAAVVGGVWSEFTDRTVHKRALLIGTGQIVISFPDLLTYYQVNTCQSQTTVQLLQSLDGQCGAWARYFRDALATQGIASDVVEVTPQVDDGFLVKNWSFAGGGAGCAASHPYFSNQVTEQFGAAGQGMADPTRSRFTNHGLVQYGTTLYDPSYGTGPFATLAQWEAQALDGFYEIVTVGIQQSVCYRKEISNVLETMITGVVP